MYPKFDGSEFEFEYQGCDLVYGRECIEKLGIKLDEYGINRALIITGSNVGANPDVMEPISSGLGDRPFSVFDETTSKKLGQTVFDGIDIIQQENPDILVGVGGGSSLDVARQMSVFAADGRPLSEFREAARKGQLRSPTPNKPLTPVAAVPTTFAGAGLSSGGSIEILGTAESPTDIPVRTKGSVTPKAVFYDPNLFETTPIQSLAGSAMNGFNKGVETLYASDATPITNATAIRGLQLLCNSLPQITDDSKAMEQAVIGTIMVRFECRVSIVHAIGHRFARRYNLQQGIFHAIIVPHVLRYLFEHTDAGRKLLAEGFGIVFDSISEETVAAAIIKEIESVRSALNLPSRLRELDPVQKEDIPVIAQSILEDDLIVRGPTEINPTVSELENILYNAW